MSEATPFMKDQPSNEVESSILPHVRNYIMSATPAQLQQMRRDLTSEINKGIAKNRPNHSYTAELELIVSRLKDRSKGQ